MVRAGTLPRPRSGRGAGPLDRPSHDPTRPAGQQRRQSDRLQRRLATPLDRPAGPARLPGDDEGGYRRDCGWLRKGEADDARHTRGIGVRAISLPRRAPQLRRLALFIHSADDHVVAIEDSLASPLRVQALAKRVEGLGPRRLLVNPVVVAAAIEFVATSHRKGALS